MTREELLDSKDYTIQCEAIDKWNAYNDEGVKVDYTDGYLDGYLKAKSESDWHEYPADPPEKSGEYIVIVDAGGTWHSSWWSDEDKAFTVWDNHITAWMPVPEYIPKK